MIGLPSCLVDSGQPRTAPHGRRDRHRRWLAAAILIALWPIASCRQTPEEAPARPAPASAPTPGAPAARPVEDVSGLPRKTAPPGTNVLLVSVDTTRADHLGCYGHEGIKTPNIDRLAAEGVRFEWCISSAPLTLVSHSTMMTGSYQYVHGARDNGLFSLDDANVTLAEILHDAGYATEADVASVILNSQYNMDQGFEVYKDVRHDRYAAAAAAAEDWQGGEVRADAKPKPKSDPRLGEQTLERNAEEISRSGIERLRRLESGDRPFFIFLHYYDPHWPREAPDEFRAQYEDAYDAEIAYFDSEFGKLLDEVDRLGLADNTMVVLVSDHGEGRGQHGESTHSAFLYDSTLHVPMIMRCRGIIPSGEVVSSQVRLVDLAPTILDFVGLADKSTGQMQGVSLCPFFARSDLALDLACYADTIVPKAMYGMSQLRSLRTLAWKYILAPVPELYEVVTDRLELFNLATTETDRAMRMRQNLWDLIESSPDPPGARAALREMKGDTEAQLQALGYVSSAEDLAALGEGSELDHFEPEGENPRDHIEKVELLCKGMGAQRVGMFESADLIFRRLLKLSPDQPVVVGLYAANLAAMSRFEESAEYFARAVALQRSNCDNLRKYGVVLTMLKRFKDAEGILREAAECNPEDVVAMTDLAGVLSSMRRFDEALSVLAVAEERRANHPLVFYQRGVVEMRQLKFEKAQASFERAIELDPDRARNHIAKASVLRKLNQVDEAIAYLESVARRMPDDKALAQYVASLHGGRGDVEQAGHWLQRIAEIDPEDADAHYYLARNYLRGDQADRALQAIDTAVKLDPESSEYLDRKGVILSTLGRQAEALDVYARIIEMSPDQALAYHAAAKLAFALNLPDRVVELLGKGVEQFPGDAQMLNSLAWRLATLPDASGRDGPRALELAELANRLTEDENPFFLDTLAAAYAENGRFDDAVKTAERAMEKAGDFQGGQVREDIASRRDRYVNRQPFREAPPAPSEAVSP